MPTNIERAVCGRDAIRAGVPGWEENDARDNVIDALANVMHYADVKGIDVRPAVDMAYMHFTNEADELEGDDA